jgi:hypothetical protein
MDDEDSLEGRQDAYNNNYRLYVKSLPAEDQVALMAGLPVFSGMSEAESVAAPILIRAGSCVGSKK